MNNDANHAFDGRFTNTCHAVVDKAGKLGRCEQPREAHKSTR